MERYRSRPTVTQQCSVSVRVRVLIVWRKVRRVSWSKGHPSRSAMTDSELSGTEETEQVTKEKRRWDILQDSKVMWMTITMMQNQWDPKTESSLPNVLLFEELRDTFLFKDHQGGRSNGIWLKLISCINDGDRNE